VFHEDIKVTVADLLFVPSEVEYGAVVVVVSVADDDVVAVSAV
jgi:hypothetical protein